MGGTTDKKEDLAFVTLQSKQCINSWKAHLLRSTNQDESRPDVIDELDEASALLVLDRAMTYVPKNLGRAKQTGLVREIFHGISRLQREREMMARFR